MKYFNLILPLFRIIYSKISKSKKEWCVVWAGVSVRLLAHNATTASINR